MSIELAGALFGMFAALVFAGLLGAIGYGMVRLISTEEEECD